MEEEQRRRVGEGEKGGCECLCGCCVISGNIHAIIQMLLFATLINAVL